MKIKTRLARTTDLDDLKLMLSTTWSEWGFDWTGFERYWVVAADPEDRAIGCVQTLFGVPFSQTDHLAVNPNLNQITKSRVIARLLEDAQAIMIARGAKDIVMFVPDDMPTWHTVLKRRGAMTVEEGRLMIRRLVANGCKTEDRTGATDAAGD